MRQMHFEPSRISAAVGEVVEWKNEDIYAHTVTADDGSFDSGPIEPGRSWTRTITKADNVGYHCRPHPNMSARLNVTGGAGSHSGDASAQPTSSPSLGWSMPSSPQQIHPILVNFTAALLPLALLSDIMGRIFRAKSLHDSAWWMLLYAAALTPLTVAAGWWWKSTTGPTLPPKLITVHQWLGTAAAMIFILLAVWRWTIRKRGVAPSVAYLSFALIAVLALVYQGSIGGAMVFGK